MIVKVLAFLDEQGGGELPVGSCYFEGKAVDINFLNDVNREPELVVDDEYVLTIDKKWNEVYFLNDEGKTVDSLSWRR